jgi:hypothetical protein
MPVPRRKTWFRGRRYFLRGIQRRGTRERRQRRR